MARKRIKARPLTNAEKQRRYREKRKVELDKLKDEGQPREFLRKHLGEDYFLQRPKKDVFTEIDGFIKTESEALLKRESFTTWTKKRVEELVYGQLLAIFRNLLKDEILQSIDAGSIGSGQQDKEHDT